METLRASRSDAAFPMLRVVWQKVEFGDELGRLRSRGAFTRRMQQLAQRTRPTLLRLLCSRFLLLGLVPVRSPHSPDFTFTPIAHVRRLLIASTTSLRDQRCQFLRAQISESCVRSNPCTPALSSSDRCTESAWMCGLFLGWLYALLTLRPLVTLPGFYSHSSPSMHLNLAIDQRALSR